MTRWLLTAALRLFRPQRMAHYRELTRTQWLEPEALAELQLSKLRSLLRHAEQNVPYYREIMRAGHIRAAEVTLESLRDFPLTDKRLLTERKDDFVAENIGAAKLLSLQTGGSTGYWFRFYNDTKSSEIRRALDMRGMNWIGWRVGEKQAVLWGHPRGDTTHTGLESRLQNFLFKRSLVLNTFYMDNRTIRDYQRRIMAFRPVILYGYTSTIVFLAEYLRRENLPFPPLRAVLCTAETLTDEYRQTIAAYFRCPVYNRYGCREVNGIAQHCDRGKHMHMLADHSIIEILDTESRACSPGQMGEVVVTDLDNYGMPFIRYRTGDLAVAAEGRCPCGRSLPLLQRVEGRASEILVGKNGQLSWAGPIHLREGMTGFDKMQILQENYDEIEILLVPNRDWADAKKEILIARMQRLLGPLRVKITMVDDIKPSASGKYQFVISKVSPYLKR